VSKIKDGNRNGGDRNVAQKGYERWTHALNNGENWTCNYIHEQVVQMCIYILQTMPQW
jgi:hypothetical protein